MNTAHNADPREVERFELLAARWWDPEGEFRTLHGINPLRLAWVRDESPLAGLRVVDVGCGGGLLAEAMANEGADVLGIDLGSESLQVARLHGLESGVRVEYRHIGAEALAEEMPGAFDLVTCMELLEHVPDPRSLVAACARLARPGGTVVFSTLNRNAQSWLKAIVGAEYLLGLLPRGTHDWSRFLRPSELEAMTRAVGLTLTRMTGIAYNPLTRAFRLDPDVRVNYMAAFRRAS